MKHWVKTYTFWLAALSAAYSAAAGALVALSPTLLTAMPEALKTILAVLGVILPGLAAAGRIFESKVTS